MRHVIVHQFDPHQHVAGGIDSLIRELLRYAPVHQDVSLIGVETRDAGSDLGQWRTVDVLGREIRFMPVAHVDRNQPRRIPHTVKFVAGLLRYRPKLNGAILHSHRAEVSAAVSILYPDVARVLFLQGDAVDDLRYASDSFWSRFPPAYAAMERFAVKRADETISYTNQGQARVRRYTNRVSRGRNWFVPGLNRCSETRPGGIFTIAWIGRFEAPKDPLKAIATFNCLRQKGFAFKAWMAGNGLLHEAAHRAVSERGLQDHVDLLGLATREDVADRLRRSHVLLMSSQFEGFPRVAVESLASGVPVVAPAVGAIPDLILDGANGFVAARLASGDELADLIIQTADIPYGRAVATTVADLNAEDVLSSLFVDLDKIGSDSYRHHTR